MASTYSTNLRLELITTGEQQGTWGATTNKNLGSLLEQAISGWQDIAVDNTGVTETTLNMTDGELSTARNMIIELSGTITSARNVICPTNKKMYTVRNATSGGFPVTFKVAGQTGVSIPFGQTVIVYVDGTDVRQASLPVSRTNVTQISSIELGAASDTTITRASAGVIAVEGKNVALNGTTEVLTTGTIELGAASDTTIARVSAGVIAVEGKKIVTEDASGNAAITGVVVQSSSFLRNRIINGDMKIDQRNAGGAVIPTTSTFTLDRWQFQATQASKMSIQQTTSAANGPPGFPNYMSVTTTTAFSVAAGDYFAMRTAIEGQNISDFAWGTANAKTVALSFYAWATVSGTYGGAISNGALNRSYPFSYTVSNPSSWQLITVIIPGDTTGTWTVDNTVGLNLYFGLGSGATFAGTAGAWAAANYVTSTGATSVVGTLSRALLITGVQLEAGSVATPFERRQYGQELALCQRYYETGTTIVPAVGVAAYMTFFAAAKRATPTIAGLGAGAAATASTNGFYASQTTAASQLYTASAEL
jgi:hypothetical protein